MFVNPSDEMNMLNSNNSGDGVAGTATITYTLSTGARPGGALFRDPASLIR